VSSGISLSTLDDFASKYINQYDDVRICAMRSVSAIINEANLTTLENRLAKDVVDSATAVVAAPSIDAHQITRSAIQLLLRIQCTTPADKNFTRSAKDNDNDDHDTDSKSDKVLLLLSFALMLDILID
jgi:hypothetical protein